MQLIDYPSAPGSFKSGHEDNISITAGQRFTIETSPGGAEILDEECPVGKVWSVRVIVEITETDA